MPLSHDNEIFVASVEYWINSGDQGKMNKETASSLINIIKQLQTELDNKEIPDFRLTPSIQGTALLLQKAIGVQRRPDQFSECQGVIEAILTMAMRLNRGEAVQK